MLEALSDLWANLPAETQDVVLLLALLIPGLALGLLVTARFRPWPLVLAMLWRYRWTNLLFAMLMGLSVAVGVGLTALPVAVATPQVPPTVAAAVFGFAAGVFLHVAMDFLPECEAGGEIHDAIGDTETDHVHAALDRLRTHAVGSTAVGGLLVFVAWLAIAP